MRYFSALWREPAHRLEQRSRNLCGGLLEMTTARKSAIMVLAMPLLERERFSDVVTSSTPAKLSNVETITELYRISAQLEQFSVWLNSKELLDESVKVRMITRQLNLDALRQLERERVK
jgi:hypothetical protein